MNGWLKLHRKLISWEWYSCINTTRVFIHLLLTASWKNARWQGMEIPRGSVFASPDNLAAATGLSRQQVRTVLNRLKSTSEITTKSTSKGTLITLSNFDTYNGDDEEFNQQVNQQVNQNVTSVQPAFNQRLTTSKEGKEGVEGNNERKKEVTKNSSADKKPNEVKAKPDSRETFDAFFREIGLFANDAEYAWLHWEENEWMKAGKKIKDWKATVRKWKAGAFFPSQKHGGTKQPWLISTPRPDGPPRDYDDLLNDESVVPYEVKMAYGGRGAKWRNLPEEIRQAIKAESDRRAEMARNGSRIDADASEAPFEGDHSGEDVTAPLRAIREQLAV